MIKTTRPKSLWRLVVASAIYIAVPAQADTTAFSFGGESQIPPANFTGDRGWSFWHGVMTVTQIGVFDSAGDGLTNPHQLGLWRLDGTLLASATVPAGSAAPLIDGYRYVSIPSVTFAVSDFAVVAAQYSVGDADDLVTPFRGGYNGPIFPPFAGRYGLGSDLPFPSLQTSGSQGNPSPTFDEVNFQFVPVPEPSVCLFVLPALTYFLWRLRNRIRC